MQGSHRSCFFSNAINLELFKHTKNVSMALTSSPIMGEGVKLMSYDKNRLNSYFFRETKSNKKMFILKHFLFDFQ